METTIANDNDSNVNLGSSGGEPSAVPAGRPSAVPADFHTHHGSCHCGAVRFDVELDLAKGGSRCNCSICAKVGQLGTIVKPDAFKLVAGQDSLSFYVWGAKISRRFFCKTCGVHCFGSGFLAEVGGDFVSVNLNCLDGVELGALATTYWDGRHDNWYAGMRATPWPILGDVTPVPPPSGRS